MHQLLKADVKNLNIQDELLGDTPLIAACKGGNVSVVKYLLDRKADVSIRNKVFYAQPSIIRKPCELLISLYEMVCECICVCLHGMIAYFSVFRNKGLACTMLQKGHFPSWITS